MLALIVLSPKSQVPTGSEKLAVAALAVDATNDTAIAAADANHTDLSVCPKDFMFQFPKCRPRLEFKNTATR